MRHRTQVAKSDKAAASASKVNRLSRLTVEEVSIVDRPANKRTFFVVKSEKGGEEKPPADPPAPPEPKPAAAVRISPAEKAKLAAALKAITEKVAAVAKVLDGAEAVDGAATSQEITTAFAELEKTLGEEVAKAGRKISGPRLEAMRQAHTLLGQVIADAEPAAATETATEETAQKSAKPPAPVQDPELTSTLKELASTVQVLTKAVGIQKKRIDEIEAGDGGGSRQVPVEKQTTEKESVDEDVSWPLDMNRSFRRNDTPVEKSFFG